MFTQLDPPIPLNIPNKGHGIAHGVIDYGPEYDLIWVLIMEPEGQVWCVRNREVRGQTNVTIGRVLSTKESSSDE